MDTGILTIVVAAIFCAIGVVVGFLLGKTAPHSEKRHESGDTTSHIGNLESNIGALKYNVSELSKSIENSTQDVVRKQKGEIDNILTSIENLKEQISVSGLPIKSVSVLDDMLLELRGVNVNSLPSLGMDEATVTKIKDKIDIIRAEIESIKLSMEEEKNRKQEKVQTPFDFVKIEKAVQFAKEINEEAVKGDMIGLMYAFKSDDKKDLLKSIDTIALNSKQLVLILEDVLKLEKEREEK